MMKIGKIYDIDGSPMRYLYKDGFWTMFEEYETKMQRKYVTCEIEEKNLALYDFSKDVQTQSTD